MTQIAGVGDVPSHIGRYQIYGRLGRGAMGVVYAAEDAAMGRRVAIKVMMADLEEEPETRERFYREAKVTSQLAHRNIVTVFDLGEEGRRPYLVMELLDGVPLAEFLQTDPSLDTKLDVMGQVCQGLQVAHDRGVIHRDVKPSNLFVQRDGALKILDFGVARLPSSSLTASGFLVGTPDYMSPEQAQGRPVDHRSDLFSAAAVFYFMLAGRPPFACGDLPDVLRAVMHDDPPPLTDDQAPEALRRVLARALAKAPADRYQECTALRAELERVRRACEGEAQRTAQAALDRYRQVVALIDERGRLAVQLKVAGVDVACNETLARLRARFPDLARLAGPGVLMEPMDRSVAVAALSFLQAQHNREVAALMALREQAAGAVNLDPTLVRHTVVAALPQSLRARARAWWRRLGGSGGQTTTEWLMIAGLLTTIAVWYVEVAPGALGRFMKAMAVSLRTIAP